MSAVTLNAKNYEIAENYQPETELQVAGSLWNADVRACVDEHTFSASADGAFVANSTLNIAKIPKGSVITEITLSSIGDIGTAVYIGDSSYNRKYGDMVIVPASGSVTVSNPAGCTKALDADTIIFVTASGTLTDGSVLRSVVNYTSN